jgi:hypothetical protein
MPGHPAWAARIETVLLRPFREIDIIAGGLPFK